MARMDESVSRMVQGYRDIIYRFISGQSSAAQFEEQFLSYFKADQNQVSGAEFDVLDALFADVDEYVEDPELRAEVGGIDEAELQRRALRAFRRLYGEP